MCIRDRPGRVVEEARVEAGEAQASVTQLRSETESAKDVQAAADVELDKAGGKKMGLALNQEANGGKNLAISNVAGRERRGLLAKRSEQRAHKKHFWNQKDTS